MPATRDPQAGTSSPTSDTGSPGGGHRHLGHGRRPRSGAAPHDLPDVGALAREAVISFLHDASNATAEREAVRAGFTATDAEAAVTAAAGAMGEGANEDGASKVEGIPAAAPGPEGAPRDAIFTAGPGTAGPGSPGPGSPGPGTAGPGTAESVAVRAAAMSVAVLDRIEAAAAKVEADIAAAHRAYAELQAGAGAAAEAAVDAAQSALASAGVAVEAERQVKISVRQVRQYVVVTTVLLAVVLIVLAVITSPVR